MLKQSALLGALVIATSAQAGTTLTFDDISDGNGGIVPSNYGGLQWTNFGYSNSTTDAPGSGYVNGTVSGDYIAFNRFANVAAVSDALFSFNSVYLTAAWRDGLNIKVEGKLGGSTLYSQTVVVDHDAPTLFNFNYLGIDELVFDSFGGTEVPNLSGSGAHFAMDNFTFNGEASAVPTPTAALGGLALLGMVGVRRRRRSA